MLIVVIGQRLSAKDMSVEQIGEVGPTTRPRGRVRQVQCAEDVKFASFAVLTVSEPNADVPKLICIARLTRKYASA
jgi:hypothetical protein